MAHQFKVKRKDGKGWWTLPHMDQDQIDSLTGGEHTDLHHHDEFYYTEAELSIDGVLDDRYYTETEIDAQWTAHEGAADPHTPYLLADGSRPLTADWSDNAGNIILNNNKYFGIKRSSGDLVNMVYFNTSNHIYLGHASYENTIQGSPINFRIQTTTALTATTTLIDSLVPFTIGSTIEIDSILDQDDFYSDSDTALATQQSIKAYVDTEIAGIDLSAYLRHDGTVALSADWDIGASRIIQADTIRSRLLVDSGLTLANRNGTGYIYVKDGNQYVGINRVDPDVALDVYYETGSIVAQFETNSANTFIEFLDSSTGSNKVYLGAIGNDLVLFGDGTSALRITTSGLIDVANSSIVLDEDAMGSDSATQLATQQSIKSYVDTETVALDGTRAMTGALTINANYMRLQAASGGSAKIEIVGDDGEDNADFWRIESATDNKLNFANYGSGAWVDKMELDTNGKLLTASLELNGGGTGVTVDIIRDEDSMSSDDAAALATQQSIKKYVDDSVGAASVNKGYTSGSIGAVVNKDYTGISEDAVQITIYYRNVSNNNASYAPIIQLKNQSAIQTTGYESHVMTGSSNDRNNTDGIHYCNSTADHGAADIYDGHLILNRMNSAGTVWAWQGTSIADSESSFRNATGYVILSTAFGGTVRFTSESGGATHDGGNVYVSWF